jgi:hypothetical protein
MRYQHTETGEIKTHQQWQNELGMSFHNERLPEFLIVPQHTVPEPTLEQRRERQRQVLKHGRDERIIAPINNVQVRDKDRDRIQRAIDRWDEGGFGWTRKWIMADNTIAHLTKAELQTVLDAYDIRELTVFEQYQQMLAQLAESNEPELIVWPDN